MIRLRRWYLWQRYMLLSRLAWLVYLLGERIAVWSKNAMRKFDQAGVESFDQWHDLSREYGLPL